MPISFECPHCGFQTEVAERYAGQSGTCANCHQSISVPGKAIQTRPTRDRNKSGGVGFAVVGVLGLLVFAGLLLGLMFLFVGKPATNVGGIAAATNTAEQIRCGENLAKIGVAIEKYVAAKGHYPPAYTTDEDGKPMHSWRVLLLPYLGENKLYAKYDLDKPWDDPANQHVIARMPRVYRCPMEKDVTDESAYMVLTGEGFLFDGDAKREPNAIKDDVNSALLVVEVSDTSIQWTEPKDLSLDTIDWTRSRSNGLGSKHTSGGLHVLTADGEVHHLGEFVTPEALKAMATIDGGETVDAASWTDQ